MRAPGDSLDVARGSDTWEWFLAADDHPHPELVEHIVARILLPYTPARMRRAFQPRTLP